MQRKIWTQKFPQFLAGKIFTLFTVNSYPKKSNNFLAQEKMFIETKIRNRTKRYERYLLLFFKILILILFFIIVLSNQNDRYILKTVVRLDRTIKYHQNWWYCNTFVHKTLGCCKLTCSTTAQTHVFCWKPRKIWKILQVWNNLGWGESKVDNWHVIFDVLSFLTFTD